MKEITINNIKMIKECPFKGYIHSFGLTTDNNKNKIIRQVYKKILLENDFLKYSNNQLLNKINEELDDRLFLTKQEKEVEVQLMNFYLNRYINYEKNKNRTVILKHIYDYIEINNKQIKVGIDIVFEDANNIEVVKYKFSPTKLSYKARKKENLPINDIELYAMGKLANKLFSKKKKNIIISHYHLIGKKENSDYLNEAINDMNNLYNIKNKITQINCSGDKKKERAINKKIKEINDIIYFDNTIGNNIISINTLNNSIENYIIDILNKKQGFNSDKCKSFNCDMCTYSNLCNYSNCDSHDLKLNKINNKSNNIMKDNKIKLTKSQKEVINIENGNYRINAGAGSGKSTTMVLRVIELLKRGYNLEDILMITFTNKGCEELKSKITYWMNKNNLNNKKNINIYTFNSFGDNIISKEWNKIGFKKQPKLATVVDIYDCIRDILKKYNNFKWLNYKSPLLNYPNSKGAFIEILMYFNMIKSFSLNKQDFVEKISKIKKDLPIEELKIISEEIFIMYHEFNQLLQEKNLLQYQDQILYVIKLFKEYPNLIEQYGYKHIIVDEYQDTDNVQVELIKLLYKYNDFQSLVVVGDDLQSIYSFRNTTPKNILDFNNEFNNVKDIFLLENFRSTPQICEVANNLIKFNKYKVDKDIISKKDNGMLPQLIKCNTLDDENKYIVNLIKQLIDKENIPKHEICYIARTKKELLVLKEVLDKENISNILDVPQLYLEDNGVKCILGLVDFFKNNKADYSLLEYILMTNNIENFNNDSNIEKTLSNFKSQIIKEMNEIDNDEKAKIDYFYNIISKLAIDNEIVKSFISNIQKENTYATLDSLLNYLLKIKIYKDNSCIEKDDNKYDAVVLTTAHSSKGKEWKVVINSINKYKYDDILDNEELLEEERRLLFVSITRAKDNLYMTYNINKDKIRNKGKYCKFIDEIQEYFSHNDLTTK